MAARRTQMSIKPPTPDTTYKTNIVSLSSTKTMTSSSSMYSWFFGGIRKLPPKEVRWLQWQWVKPAVVRVPTCKILSTLYIKFNFSSSFSIWIQAYLFASHTQNTTVKIINTEVTSKLHHCALTYQLNKIKHTALSIECDHKWLPLCHK